MPSKFVFSLILKQGSRDLKEATVVYGLQQDFPN